MNLSVLDRELYAIPEAAKLLRVPPSTLQWWLEGGKRGRKLYPPVLRSDATGSKVMTWGEFVEARYLREYRRALDVPLQQLRLVIDSLREEFGVPYPLAHFKPFVAGNRELVLHAQEEAGLDAEFWLVVGIASGQTIYTPATEGFLDRVEFSDVGDLEALRIYPAGKGSPVVVDPERSFGVPTVRGIRTDVLAELVDAGDPVDAIAEDYDLPIAELKAAIAYEWTPAPSPTIESSAA